MAQCESSDIGPVRVRVLGYGKALDLVAGMIGEGGERIVAFCNAHTVNLARRDAAFRDALGRAVVLNDGVGLDLGRRILHGARFPANLNGTDFTPALLEHAPGPLKVFLLGSPPGVAERAAAALARRFPRHRIVGTRDGFFPPAEGGAVARAIAETGADLVLVGMGQPRQELWAARHAAASGALALCIGAYLDFAAGAVRRAPGLVQAMRIEWAYRLAQEPRRLAGRYLLGNFRFMLGVARDKLGRGQG